MTEAQYRINLLTRFPSLTSMEAWAAAIIGMSPISREEAREAWGVTNSAADSRLDSLELGGFATRTEGKPLRWHINTEGRQG